MARGAEDGKGPDNSLVQLEDDDEEDIGAEGLSSGLIDFDNVDDVELSEGEVGSEEEENDQNDEPENEADEAGSDDDGYADL